MSDRTDNRRIRVRRLDEQGREDELAHTSPADRLAMVWPLTVTAWTFKDGSFAQSRLQRHLVRIQRGRG